MTNVSEIETAFKNAELLREQLTSYLEAIRSAGSAHSKRMGEAGHDSAATDEQIRMGMIFIADIMALSAFERMATRVTDGLSSGLSALRD